MFLFQKIDELTVYNDSRSSISRFILEKRGKLGQYTLQEVADKTHTAKSTLVRYAQNLGYKGWREFCSDFVEEAYHQDRYFSDIDPNVPFTAEDSTLDIINRISSLEVESILDTADLLDIPTLEHAAQMVMGARHTVIYGLSPNSLVGELFRRKMLGIGRNVTICRVDEGGTFAGMLDEQDCVIVISYAGNQESRAPMKYIPLLEENNVQLIGITSGGHSYIRDHLKCVLTMSSHERLYSKIAGYATEISVLTILNILYSCCFKMDYERSWNYKVRHFSALESERFPTVAEMTEHEEEKETE